MANLLSGFSDEAGWALETQIRATKALGWKNIDLRNVEIAGTPALNANDLPDKAFNKVVDALDEAGLHIYCIGSTIANGGQSIRKPFDYCLGAAKRVAARIAKAKTKMVRIMSYPILKDQEDQMEAERFRRLREVVSLFTDLGVTVVHENCDNYGGMGGPFALKMLENVPGLKLAFDMGNCTHDLDYTKPEPRPYLSAWDFYRQVREHIAHVHVKDGLITPEGKHLHVFPGEGAGDVKRILADLLANGYQGAFAIEPHIGISPLFASLPDPKEAQCQTYIEFGKRLEKMLASI